MNGNASARLPNTLNVYFEGVEASMLLEALQSKLAASTGSACAAGSNKPSHVLKAMGMNAERLAGSIRLSIGRTTTEAQISEVVQHITKVVEHLRSMH